MKKISILVVFLFVSCFLSLNVSCLGPIGFEPKEIPLAPTILSLITVLDQDPAKNLIKELNLSNIYDPSKNFKLHTNAPFQVILSSSSIYLVNPIPGEYWVSVELGQFISNRSYFVVIDGTTAGSSHDISKFLQDMMSQLNDIKNKLNQTQYPYYSRKLWIDVSNFPGVQTDSYQYDLYDIYFGLFTDGPQLDGYEFQLTDGFNDFIPFTDPQDFKLKLIQIWPVLASAYISHPHNQTLTAR